MVLALAAILAVLLVFFLVLKVVGVLIGLVWLLLVATLCGAIGESVVHYKQGGIGTTVGVGLVGALVGWLIAHLFHLWMGPTVAHLPLIWTVVGSIALVGTMKVVAPVNRRLSSGRGGVARW
ncbi:MAG TPA: hypothetical protein VFA70_02475 [Dehalococcoidia bacterium]|jgi:uncharacterized membrane protein YeaQ/YmgE (transglycosylase-associated protein family)|nr:hypothetical protein [Dehalococcoidia bacterium]